MSTNAAILRTTNESKSADKTRKRQRTSTAATTNTPWVALRFASTPTEANALRMMQAYGLETDTETFIRMVLMGHAPEDIGHGMYESDLVSNGRGGFEFARDGTHYIFTIPPYMERGRTLLPLFPDAVALDPASDSHRLVVKKLK